MAVEICVELVWYEPGGVAAVRAVPCSGHSYCQKRLYTLAPGAAERLELQRVWIQAAEERSWFP